MKFNTIIHLPKIAFLALLTALLIACGDTTTAPNTDISGYSLTYNNIGVPQNTASSVSVSPNWSVTPTEVSYSISPNLPSGATLNPTTGVISGTINISAGTTTYTVTATGSGANTGTTTATFTITATDPIDLSGALFTYSDINVHVNSPASTSPMWTNNAYPVTATYQVSPSLPAGLSIDANSGVISGTPAAPVPTSSYTITATGTGVYTGSTTTTLNITVAGAGQTLLNTLSLNYNNIGVSYSNGVEVYTINISTTPNPTIANISPQWSNQGAAVNPSNITYTITPPLPVWLSLDAGTGEISRTATAPSLYYRQHTVTATDYGTNGNYVGTKDATVVIAIAENANNGNIQSLVDTQIGDQGDYANLNIIDTSMIIIMTKLFENKANFNGDISRWDVSSVTDMGSMFSGASAFNGDLSKWNVSRVTIMGSMFSGASAFNGDISKWNVSRVNSMVNMFFRASAFDGDISKWNVSRVTTMDTMFSRASAFDGDISSWKVSNVTTMNNMFNRASSFNQDISGWDVSRVTTMDTMFFEASSFTADLEAWNVATTVSTIAMFNGSAVNIPLWYRNLSYTPITFLATVGYDIGNQEPTWDIPLAGNNDRDVTYTISPDISGIGLSLNATSGVISGTIANTNIASNYTITAKPTAHPQNSGKTATVSFVRTTLDIATLNLNYSNIEVFINTPAQSTPNWSGQTYPVTATYTVSPALPSGLTLNSTNGIISGSPLNNQLSSNYTITATGNGAYSGSKTSTFSIIVGNTGEIFLDNLTLSYNNIGVNIVGGVETYTINISNTANPTITETPQWIATPTNTTYAVDPALPTWLGINSTNGNITNNGSPSAYYSRHTITATGNGGYIGNASKTIIIAIAITAGDRTHLTNLVDTQIATQGDEANLNIINTSRVTDMSSVFFNSSFNGDISRWNVGNVTNMERLFFAASSFNGDISSWDVSKVTIMEGIFYIASAFNNDISSWNVGNVVNMQNMFNDTRAFNNDISSWNVGNVTNMSGMFNSARAFNTNLSSWNVSKVTDMRGMFANTTAFQGNGLSSWAGKLGSVTTMANMFRSAAAFTENLESWNVPSSVNITNMFISSGVANNKPSWCTMARGC